ncbi:M23 family metallopeptidase [Sediminibacter sp. Hel_I_10]|uniref:M23 family metallopeptidase n=1 Tax=Sediminibacter sp. Hel_I_10 TaxID=1392490 RepID=UPI000560B5B5|nr:M23 family metallopeptidase [Sediminibacter sp. Hel_I_10]
MRYLIFIIVLGFVFSCSDKLKTPNYIIFNQIDDSINISAINELHAPYQIAVENENGDLGKTFVLNPNDTVLLSKINSKVMDTLQILKTFKFKTAYGNPELIAYDSLYSYQPPFSRGKSYKILQGNSTNFTHNTDFSKYALDFKIPIGDTICAAREGFVVGVVSHNYKQGTNASYRDFANYITMYHNDGTFSQYVHLDTNGALIEVNDFVEVGEPIAISGHTGWSTEPHLHFAVFKSEPFKFVSIPFVLDSKKSTDFIKWEIVKND